MPGDYDLSVESTGKTWPLAKAIVIPDGASLTSTLQLSSQAAEVRILPGGEESAAQASGGERLSSGEVSSLPLNARDFSKLLLLAAGTMTDANGAANFTQQFAVNGQRGTATVFSLDGFDTTDPEMGGATFSNFNVDAIQEVQSNTGVHDGGDRSRRRQLHQRDHEIRYQPGARQRSSSSSAMPPSTPATTSTTRASLTSAAFLPLCATNSASPTAARWCCRKSTTAATAPSISASTRASARCWGPRKCFPSPPPTSARASTPTTFPGDTLTVPVNPAIVPVLDHYPLPNDPKGAYGDRTYAASSKIYTRTDQFSVRVDHRISDKASLLDPLQPEPGHRAADQSRPDRDRSQLRGSVFRSPAQCRREILAHASLRTFISDTSFSYIRSTPFFPAINHTQPAMTFGDGLFQAFNQPGGSIFGSYSNLYQLKQDMSYVHSNHVFKWGVEIRHNRDATIFGTNPNGQYTFGGGTAYSPVLITSASGTHDIQPGDPLPDSLTGLLTATPYSYGVIAAADVTPIGDRFDEAAVRREAYNFYFQDTWKARPNLTINYGLRYEVNSRIHEAEHRTSLPRFVDAGGKRRSLLGPQREAALLLQPAASL